MPGERRVYRTSGVRIASTFALPELPRAGRGPIAHHVERREGGRPAMPVEWYHRWLANARPWLRFGRSAAGYVLSFPRWADFVVAPDGSRVSCYPSRGLPARTLRHLLLDQVLPLAFTLAGRLVVHASAVHVPGFGAVAFAGRSGRGKSTLAATLVAAGCELLTDDTLVVERHGGAVVVLPSYPGVRLWPVDAGRHGGARVTPVAHYTTKRRVAGTSLRMRDRPSRLRALFLMAPRRQMAAPLRVRTCAPRACLMALVRVAYTTDIHDRRQLARIFEGVGWMTENVPIAILTVRDSRRALPSIGEAVRMAVREVASGV